MGVLQSHIKLEDDFVYSLYSKTVVIAKSPVQFGLTMKYSPRNRCLTIVRNPWFERLTLSVIFLNAVPVQNLIFLITGVLSSGCRGLGLGLEING